MEIWHSDRVVYDGRIVRLRVGEVTLDDGRLALREVVEHPGGVCVLPCTGHSVILVRQFRIAAGAYVLEAPAGKLEPGEDPAHRGACELEEEVGYRAGRLEFVNAHYASVGYCSERIHGYLAFDLEKTVARPEEDERIEVVELPLPEVWRGLDAHAFEDGKTVLLMYALRDRLRRAGLGE